jgi:hypothetical protein
MVRLASLSPASILITPCPPLRSTVSLDRGATPPPAGEGMNCRRLVRILHRPGIAAQLALSACAAEVPPRHFPVAAESLLVAFRRSDQPTAGALAIRWRILGRRGSGFVSIVNADSLDAGKTALRSAGPVHHLKERIFRRPFRPNNTPAKYDRGVWGNRPFCGCNEAH